MVARNNERNRQVRYLSLCVGILAVISFPSLLPIILRLFSKSSAIGSACENYFYNETYTDGRPVNTILIGIIHGSDEEHAADCIESLAASDDHLLIEAEDSKKEIKCDTIHTTYKRFNGKLKCYGFDVSIDEPRRIYGDLSYRANFIAKKSSLFFNNAKSSKEVTNSLISFADILEKHKSSLPFDPNFPKRQAKYFKKLAKKMSGLSIPEMRDFLIQENNRLAAKAEYYEELSRKGPTNDALVSKITSHQQQLSGSRHRLFAVVGARHLDTAVNTQLKKIVEGDEPVTILASKAYK